MSREEIAYLRRYADAAGILAEMAMSAKHGFTGDRFVAYYDDEASEWVVARQWYDGWKDGGTLLEGEIARSSDFPDAVNSAYEMIYRAADR